MCAPKSVSRGFRDRIVEYTTCVLGITVFAQSFHYNRKFEAKAVRLYSFRNPRKAMFAPKSVSRGVAGSYSWVYYIGKENSVFAQSFHCNREFRGQSWSAVLISRNPRKAMFAPKSVSRGVAGSYGWVYYIGKENFVFAQSFHCNREFRGQGWSAVLISRNPRKAMCAPKSVSRGVAGSYCWVYYMGIGDYSICSIFPLQQKIWSQSCSAVLISRNPRKAMFAPKSVSRGVAGSYGWVYYMGIGDSVFVQSFHCKREFRGQGWSAVFLSRNPRKAMFAPKSVSREVAGSYCWVYYMGIGDYSICSIFPLQQRVSRPKLFGCTHFPQPPEGNVCPQKCL